MRKADQQDINRVKRWDSPFPQEKEGEGWNNRACIPHWECQERYHLTNRRAHTLDQILASGKPMPGMKGDELMASLRQRIAIIIAEGGKWKHIKNKTKAKYPPQEIPRDSHRNGHKSKIMAKIRKANGGIAPNYNNPSKVRKKKTATKTAAGMANIGKKPWMQKDYLKKKGKHLEKTALRSARKQRGKQG